MDAVDEMRAMLVGRGAKWTSERVSNGVLFTFAKDDHTYSVFVRDSAGLEIWSQYLTPAQAIEATLGRRTCHITRKFTCSECGHQFPTRNYESYETCDGRTAFAPLGYNVLACKKPNYCPNCGATVTG